MTSTVVASHDGDMADHDPARPRRRRFSPEYKLAILAEYDRLTEPGDKGALLRREGPVQLPHRCVASSPGGRGAGRPGRAGPPPQAHPRAGRAGTRPSPEPAPG